MRLPNAGKMNPSPTMIKITVVRSAIKNRKPIVFVSNNLNAMLVTKNITKNFTK